MISVDVQDCLFPLEACAALNVYTPEGNPAGQLVSSKWSIALSTLAPNATIIAFLDPPGYVGDSYSRIRIIDLLTLTETQLSDPLQVAAGRLVWSPDGTSLLASVDGNFELISVQDSARTVVLDCSQLWGLRGPTCHPLAWSPNGKWLSFSVAFDRSGPQDPRQGTYILPGDCLLSQPNCRGPFSKVSATSTSASWAADSQHLALGDYMGQVTILDLATGSTTSVASLPGRVNSLAWSPDGSLLAYAAGNQIGLIFPDNHRTTVLPIPGVDDYTLIPFWLSVQ